MGIGTAHPNAAYKLDVYGIIHAQKVVVDLLGVPDYVFNKDYKLRSLSEVETYINEHKHLPGFNSATEIETKGADLGEMNKALLQKVEELTLHMIEQEKRISELENQVK